MLPCISAWVDCYSQQPVNNLEEQVASLNQSLSSSSHLTPPIVARKQGTRFLLPPPIEALLRECRAFRGVKSVSLVDSVWSAPLLLKKQARIRVQSLRTPMVAIPLLGSKDTYAGVLKHRQRSNVLCRHMEDEGDNEATTPMQTVPRVPQVCQEFVIVYVFLVIIAADLLCSIAILAIIFRCNDT
ncbi:hypothetical protein RIF29_41552 [Crotalaria pallida]|uniref:Uncharacterized protein n=1 Tax=Crotalaria pallida TaxID=3830 RepID=A0AAN9EBE3_CROPI